MPKVEVAPPASLHVIGPVGEPTDGAFHLFLAAMTIVVAVASFAVWTPFGVVATGLLTAVLAIAVPPALPAVILCAFLFQNLVVAWFTPFVPDDGTFDALRGANFVILMTTFSLFVLAAFPSRVRAMAGLRPWLFMTFILCLVVGFYLLLGAVRGEPKDAVVYFRNTITPVACFHIALVAATLYRVDLRLPIVCLCVVAIAYGYLEQVFRMDFLGLFHGDLYVQRGLKAQIEAGVWEKTMRETGFVLRGLEDTMTATFFNTALFADALPRIFRNAGPNFHPISYAYALSLSSAWLLFRGHRMLPLAAFPLLLLIGSKGAAFLLCVALASRLLWRASSPRLTFAVVLLLASVWTLAATIYGARHGDYHVLGFFAGIRDFLGNPLGQGLGIGGNLSSDSVNLDWDRAQEEGTSAIPVESAVGVMLSQMGIGSFAFFGFLAGIIVSARRRLTETGESDFLFAFVAVVTICANAVLQEEAFYAPLALGFCLLLVGVSFGTHIRAQQPT
ncbi:hypothetical protein MNR02_17335 (plasmid) [Shinella sp. H4-D48]|uniref:hypothetical protein n=1 Tax=Shinella sp. H4-D48 TaxID=2925841 RepID=UPI001F5314A2|nr:hypothetical protein [Shinella sp. H4-D48]UNK40281.1 hypothetical protein MNR02_17335 [Shinella sp. H4-D48]